MATSVPPPESAVVVIEKLREMERREGSGDARRVVGRETDEQGRALTKATCSLYMGNKWYSRSFLVLPDVAATGLANGQVLTVHRPTDLSIQGGDFGDDRITLTTSEAPHPIESFGAFIDRAPAARSVSPKATE